MEFYKIIEISQLDELKNLTSIELHSPYKWDLNILSPTIKRLKIENGDIKIPLSVLDNLETLILEQETEIEIYDINYDDIYELKNLKYLSLGEDVTVSKELKNNLSAPNITDLDISLNYYNIKKKLIFYFDFLDLDDEEDNNDGSNILRNLIETSPEEDINYFFGSYYLLKNLYLYFYDDSVPNTHYFKKLQAKEIKEDILKVKFSSNDRDGTGLTEESFLVEFDSNDNRENGKILRRKSKFIVNEDYNPIDYDLGYEEIGIKIYNESTIPFFEEIKERNLSLQVIKISDYIEDRYYADYTCFISKNDIKNLCENIVQFFFLRKIEIYFTYHNYEGIFDSEELETLIMNLSEMNFIENIIIYIDNSKLKESEKMLKLFPGMKTENTDEYFKLFWE